MKGVPHNLMKGRCRWCGRLLVYANIPNRGPVMAHRKGERELCNRLRAVEQDLVSRAERAEQLKGKK